MKNKIPEGYKKIQTRFGNTEIIPKNWEYSELGGKCPVTSGSTPSRKYPEFFQGKIPWVVSGELNYSIITKTEECITEEAIQDASLNYLKPGTVLIAITGLEAEGTKGKCAMLGVKATTSQSCVALQESEDFFPKFFFYYFQQFGNNLINIFAQGTKQQSLGVGLVKKMKIYLPPKKEQIKISDILSKVDDLIKKNQEIISNENALGKIGKLQNHNLEMLKKGLMQKLLTGKIQIKI